MTQSKQFPVPLMSFPKDISAPRIHTHSQAFTLIELLVVTATLSLLISLLLPALSSARATARATACASSIRQLALASDLYASDHAEHFAPGAVNIATTNLHRWHGTRRTTSEPFSPDHAPLTPYISDDAATSTALRTCPEFTHLATHDTGPAAFERSAGGYGYNNAFIGTTRRPRTVSGARVWDVESDKTGAKRSIFRRPTTTAIFADAALAADSIIEYSFLEPAFWPESPAALGGYRPDPSTHFRHRPGGTSGGTANVAWLDGHVSPQSMTHTQGPTLYTLSPAEHAIGWFGEASSNANFEP